MNLLLYKVGFPTIFLTTEDIDLFKCDPHYLVHHHNSPLAEFYNFQMTVITIFTDLVEHHREDVAQGLFGKLMEIMICYA